MKNKLKDGAVSHINSKKTKWIFLGMIIIAICIGIAIIGVRGLDNGAEELCESEDELKIKQEIRWQDNTICAWHEYEYDENGNIIKDMKYNPDGTIARGEEYIYQ